VGIPISIAARLKKVLDVIGKRSEEQIRVCSLGYPDILFGPEEAKQMGWELDHLEESQHASEIREWHGLPDNYPISSAESFFVSLGAKLEVVDIIKHRGVEIIADLGIKDSLLSHANTFDFVFDNGTLEHCFHVGQAFINAASLVKTGGYIYHNNPYNIFNHGFWGMNPTLYGDFYPSIGFEIIYMKLQNCHDPSHVVRIKDGYSKREYMLKTALGDRAGEEYALQCLAKKVEQKTFEGLIQSKYLSK